MGRKSFVSPNKSGGSVFRMNKPNSLDFNVDLQSNVEFPVLTENTTERNQAENIKLNKEGMISGNERRSKNSPQFPEVTESMVTGFDSPERSCENYSGESSPKLPSSLVDGKIEEERG